MNLQSNNEAFYTIRGQTRSKFTRKKEGKKERLDDSSIESNSLKENNWDIYSLSSCSRLIIRNLDDRDLVDSNSIRRKRVII